MLSLMLISASVLAPFPFFASLRGGTEVPPVTTNAFGRFNAKFNQSATQLSENLAVGSINNVFAAHIHCAAPGVNGPIGVTLYSGPLVSFGAVGTLSNANFTGPDAGNNCGWTSIADVKAALESGNAYVNVHTLAVPSGEIRGNVTN
jgi:hypothetical protein